jgi:hypothetical protein
MGVNVQRWKEQAALQTTQLNHSHKVELRNEETKCRKFSYWRARRNGRSPEPNDHREMNDLVFIFSEVLPLHFPNSMFVLSSFANRRLLVRVVPQRPDLL